MQALDDCLMLDFLPSSREERARTHALRPVVKRVHRCDEAVVAELERDDDTYAEGCPFPIVWFRFADAAELERRRAGTGERELGEWKYELRCPRSTTCLILKVVAPEDRMEAMGDDHDQPNIDVAFCGAHGLVVGTP